MSDMTPKLDIPQGARIQDIKLRLGTLVTDSIRDFDLTQYVDSANAFLDGKENIWLLPVTANNSLNNLGRLVEGLVDPSRPVELKKPIGFEDTSDGRLQRVVQATVLDNVWLTHTLDLEHGTYETALVRRER